MKKSIAGSLQDIAILREDGYTIKKYSPYHYRITMEGMRTVVDIWPTAGKLWRHGSSGSRMYKNIRLDMAKEFSYED